ncbi:Clp protease ClpP [Ensifer sp. ENS07]|uniref:head maturation protease, ClpP-related n=1 Tax=Ensifer sp. ENS07 TaxID=2769274 RepID=UPI0017832FEE|nr:head maturation protease, ClpP-related [Ensifer sp. ENS07]MBD9635958.1 Clp protease ClpP [Ensifer sp. ENS07]
MSLRTLPKARTFERPQNFQWDAPSDVLARWAENPLAAADDNANTISIFDVIGEDWWTGGGFTAKRCAAALRVIGNNDVTVQINSPGGDMFEGIAIYNMLRDHPAKVTVQIMGWAASAASIIAMAADEIVMGLGTFVMVHNAWGVVVGNRHDMRESATIFDGFDSAIADIYEARTGMERKAIEKLMDAETFMGPSEAVKNGFADRVDDGLKAEPSNSSHSEINARRRLDACLARTGVPRSERRRMLQQAAGTHDAAGETTTVTQDAGLIAAAKQLIESIRT